MIGKEEDNSIQEQNRTNEKKTNAEYCYGFWYEKTWFYTKHPFCFDRLQYLHLFFFLLSFSSRQYIHSHKLISRMKWTFLMSFSIYFIFRRLYNALSCLVCVCVDTVYLLLHRFYLDILKAQIIFDSIRLLRCANIFRSVKMALIWMSNGPFRKV